MRGGGEGVEIPEIHPPPNRDHPRIGYFALAETPSVITALEEWVRRRLRLCLWAQWPRVRTRYRRLRQLGMPEHSARALANARRGPWRMAGKALSWVLD